MPACLPRAHRSALVLWLSWSKVCARAEEKRVRTKGAERTEEPRVEEAWLGRYRGVGWGTLSVRRTHVCAATDCPSSGGSYILCLKVYTLGVTNVASRARARSRDPPGRVSFTYFAFRELALVSGIKLARPQPSQRVPSLLYFVVLSLLDVIFLYCTTCNCVGWAEGVSILPFVFT